jgi:hypothetical protein
MINANEGGRTRRFLYNQKVTDHWGACDEFREAQNEECEIFDYLEYTNLHER